MSKKKRANKSGAGKGGSSPAGYAAEALESRLLLAAQMIGDFAPGTPGSNPSQMVNFNGTLFFVADDGVHGYELWKSDGSDAGTVLVKDIQPGAVGALKGSWLTNFNGAVYFAADDGVNGRELWKTDGTAAGTVLVADIYAGSASSDPGITSSEDPRTHLVVGDTLYFHAADSKGDELWKTDGTRKGTVMVKDINPAAGTFGGSYPGSMTALNGLLFFRGYTGSKYTLFRSDGTPAGTFTLESATQTITSPSQLTALDGNLYFVNSIPNNADSLWRTDGTLAGTSKAATVENFIRQLTRVDNTLYCELSSGGLSKFDPVTGQIQKILTNQTFPQLFRNFTSLNGTLYFKAKNSLGWGLWQSDGTAAGTVLTKQITPDAPADGAFDPYGNGIVFFGTDSNGVEALWKSDGTTAGTTLIKAMDLPQASYQNIGTALAIGQTFYFSAVTENNGIELWKTDGTAAGTVLVKDINTAGFSFNPTSGGEVNGLAYFSANGFQLWRSDGTAAGTIHLSDNVPGNFLTTTDSIYFSAYKSGAPGPSLWRIDGTGGIVSLGVDGPAELNNANGTIYFTGYPGINGFPALWKTDGTVAGTVVLKSGLSTPKGLIAMGNRLYFSDSSASGMELWTSDGTIAGTVQVKDILAGTASSNPSSLTVVGNTLYFLADGLQGVVALWKSDGTAQGTTMVASMTDGLVSNLIAVNGLLFFLRSDPNLGRELWESDGTAGGTKMVRDIVPGPGSSKISNLLVVGNTLYFQANDVAHGAELWKTDGTAQGTQMVADITAGLEGSNPVPALNANGLLIFTARDPAHGTELWGSDGTAQGTSLLADINPGPGGSNPSGFTIANGTLFFGANDGVHGNELWKYPDIPQKLRAEAGGPYFVQEGDSVKLSSFGSTGAIASYEWDIDYNPAAGFAADLTGASPSFAGLDGISQHTVALRVRDAAGQFHIDTTQVFVDNAAPTPGASAPQSISVGAPYVLQLTYLDPGQDSPQSWKVEWGDGSVETLAGSATSASHIYTQPGWRSVFVHVTDDDGTFAVATPGVTVGGLDPAFNSTGYLALPTFGKSINLVSDMKTLGDGRILVLGYDWTIWRFMPDGTPDSSFGGGDGVIRAGIDAPIRDHQSASALALRPDGSFVVVGTFSNPTYVYYSGVIARFNSDGSSDPAFATSGGWEGMLNGVSLQDDGKILLAGTQNGKMLVIRLNENGTPDVGFGANGLVFLTYFSNSNAALSVKQLPDGHIFVGGSSGTTSGQNFTLARLTSSGALDPTFGAEGTGIARISSFDGNQPASYAIQSDGKIVAVGSSNTSSSPRTGWLIIVRYNANGSLDQSFNGTGYISKQVTNNTGANSVILDSSGRLIVGGWADFNFVLLRFLPNGQPDPDFASGGVMINAIPGVGGYITRLTLAPSGRILAVASTGSTDGVDYIMQFAQSPLSVQVLAAAPPVAADEVLIPGHAANHDILTNSQPVFKPQTQTSLFSDKRIVPKPTIKTPPRRPVPAVRAHA